MMLAADRFPLARFPMSLSRRLLLLTPAMLALAPALAPTRAWADDLAAEMAPRAIGSADAPVTVREYFSLTCPHCARFAAETFPRIKTNLIDPGKLRWVFEDFPLDQVALTAAMVARALPPDRYEPFVMALLASQMRWAFARDVNNTEELRKMAALAGMSHDTFEKTIGDTKLRDAILTAQDQAEKQYHVDSTPTFILSGPKQKDRSESGEMSYDAFVKSVAAVGGAAS
jgi:protein-disulfide isomerase